MGVTSKSTMTVVRAEGGKVRLEDETWNLSPRGRVLVQGFWGRIHTLEGSEGPGKQPNEWHKTRDYCSCTITKHC